MSEKPSFLETYSPWSSRSATPKPTEAPESKEKSKNETSETLKGNRALPDHATTGRWHLSAKDYPKDSPKLLARWFYATDAPKRKARYTSASSPKEEEALPKPKKYSAFSHRDSTAIEAAFQKLLDKEPTQQLSRPSSRHGESPQHKSKSSADAGIKREGSSIGLGATDEGDSIRVPVNEDFLFDVDVQRRELGPAFWLGPIYDVRRGSWFYQEGSNLRPCDENLSGQLEQGYLKVKPWEQPQPQTTDAATKSVSRPASVNIDEDNKEAKEEKENIPKKFELHTQRLFGTYMNSVVTYQDASTAWLLTDDFLSRMSSTVYQRFAGGGHLGGVKVVRGYSEQNKAKDAKNDGDKTPEAAKRKPIIAEGGKSAEDDEPPANTPQMQKEDSSIEKLERQMSNFDPDSQEAEARARDESEIKEGYKQTDGDDQGREIEHLVLVTHGIGQKLGLRLEMMNFIADVNMLRKTMKAVYQSSEDLQLLNSEIDSPKKNSRIQVLPVVWRHLLDFPKQKYKENQEKDVADASEDDEYPSLENITLEPPTIIRTAIRDLGLDILMYQSAYREHISETVVRECNRVYKTFKQRNPDFKGKVSLIGHSLGSAIFFDILCQQKDPSPPPTRSGRLSVPRPMPPKTPSNILLDFEVEEYYCLGSPLGLYQMLNGRKIAGRGPQWDSAPTSDPFLGASASTTGSGSSEADLFTISVNTPKCSQLFNIFHPADPIAYRLEPLISTAMASLKPQPLPYTKKGIFDVQGQGLSAIGSRVGQSVSGLWSSVTSGMASTLLNRTLGLPAESQAKVSTPTIQPKPADLSLTAIKAGGGQSEGDYEQAPTLIDGELQTLYAGFESSRRAKQSDGSRDLGESSQWAESEQRSKRLRREEAKVRALNSNGRVDFAIQT
ncbi:MAG: hypothetical protein OHK93_001171 [Ramalina farinacea]|uniref:DDHD domain-containing protein n=1 Tax=Ramalina farinacea TaxID=258253 RepID=A0AA43QP00_9LECA|nr:hypothetical protein [Ramalina farinacea]